MEKKGSIRVTSKRSGGVRAMPHEIVVPADRRNRILGNPHILHNHRDDEERRAVIAAHGRDLDRDIATGGPISVEIMRLAKRVAHGECIALECWCKPRPCHADRYVALVLEQVDKLIAQR